MAKAAKTKAHERPATMLWLARFAAAADYYQGRRPACAAALERAGLRRIPTGPLAPLDFEKLRRFEAEAERDALRRDRRCA
jgi:hypothetical protein